MANNVVKFYQTTSSKYATSSKDSNALYFLTDTKQIYKGADLYAADFTGDINDILTGDIATITNDINTLTGQISSVSGQVLANDDDISFISGTLLSGFTASNTVSAAIEAIKNAAINVTGVSGVTITDGTGTEKIFSAQIKSGEKVLDVDANGLFTDITLSTTTTTNGYLKSYALFGKNGQKLGESIDIPKDQFLKNAEFIPSASIEQKNEANANVGGGDDIISTGDPCIRFTFETKQKDDATGAETLADQVVYINLKDIFNTYTAGSGIVQVGASFNLSGDTNLDTKFLQIGENTIGLSGITDEITGKVKEVTDIIGTGFASNNTVKSHIDLLEAATTGYVSVKYGSFENAEDSVKIAYNDTLTETVIGTAGQSGVITLFNPYDNTVRPIEVTIGSEDGLNIPRSNEWKLEDILVATPEALGAGAAHVLATEEAVAKYVKEMLSAFVTYALSSGFEKPMVEIAPDELVPVISLKVDNTANNEGLYLASDGIGISGVSNTIDTKLSSSMDTLLSTEIKPITGNISTITGNISTITGNVNTITGNISTITGNISTITGNVNTITGNIQNLSSNVDNILSGFTSTASVSSAIGNLSAAIDNVQNAAISVTGVNGVSVTGDGTEKTVSAVIKSGDKVLSVDASGLSSTISLVKLGTATDGYAASYKLVGKDGTTALGDTINIPKDQFLKNAEFIPSASVEDQNATEYGERPDYLVEVGDPCIKFTFAVKDESGNETTIDKVVYVNVKNLVDTYTQGTGITISSNVVSLNVAGNTIGGIKSGGDISVNASGDVTVLSASQLKHGIIFRDHMAGEEGDSYTFDGTEVFEVEPGYGIKIEFPANTVPHIGINKANNSESYLYVNSNGIGISGITDAITGQTQPLSTVVGNINNALSGYTGANAVSAAIEDLADDISSIETAMVSGTTDSNPLLKHVALINAAADTVTYSTAGIGGDSILLSGTGKIQEKVWDSGNSILQVQGGPVDNLALLATEEAVVKYVKEMISWEEL